MSSVVLPMIAASNESEALVGSDTSSEPQVGKGLEILQMKMLHW